MKKQQPISFAIGIPTINQWEVLEKYLKFYMIDFPGIQIFVVDNGKQVGSLDILFSCTLFNEEKNIGVAASWNKLCQAIFAAGHTHAMICNDDVYPGPVQERITTILQSFPRDLYKTSRDDWSVFIMPKTTFEKIGPFNTDFYPAYFEDRDYRRRMQLAGCTVMESIKFDPMIYKESQSSKKDPSLLDRFDENEALYVRIWGGKPGFEKFTQPFNGIKTGKTKDP